MIQWVPVQEEGSDMQTTTAVGTEAYMQQEEQDYCEWRKNYAAQEQKYLNQIDSWLSEATLQSRENLCRLFQNQEFLAAYRHRTPIAFMGVILRIYHQESLAKRRHTILDMGTSHSALISKFQELKFILWRLEFAKDPEAGKWLPQYIEVNQATPEMLREMLDIASIEKGETGLKLAQIFREQGMYSFEFQILLYLNAVLPQNGQVLSALAELCEKAGQPEQAQRYLAQIKTAEI